ncbi:MAG: flavodoxin family protein [Spirochaetaceae bacterium]|jgi:multimeric flavodoxin WrbA|nr:flavodoxin family protein [Spirochaetaceae bacterium]
MKVIAFNGSPHRDGVIHKGLAVMTEELEKEGVSVELIHVGNQTIRGCIDCRKCRELGRCVFDDDLVNRCAEKLSGAEGIILGSPTYYGGIAGTFKSFLDRLFFPGPDLRYKAGAVVASLRRSGGIGVFHQLNNYLNLTQVIITPGVYWSVIHGNNAEEVLEDEEGLQIMAVTGRNMAWLLKTLAAGRETVAYPPAEKRKRTNFIH